MKTKLNILWVFIIFISACGGHDDKDGKKENTTPQVLDNGKKIVFPNPETALFFETEVIGTTALNAEITAPAKVSATIVKSEEGASQNIVLFENTDLAGNYTQLIQHLININQIQNINIKQKKSDLERIKDLQLHGAATGKDLSDAQIALSVEENSLANERAGIIEHETKLKAGGFQPELMQKAPAGTAYIICDLPENQLSKVQEGSNCTIQFTSFPNEKFTGKIDDVADMIDQNTRMVKLRVSINNNNGKLKAGMFATVSFGVSEGNSISVHKNSLITVQAKNYVFVKTSVNIFERKEVNVGNQIGDRIIIFSGLKNGETIAVKGAMQLKGLSFGY
ncbi:MAG: efflux RND transporter periplasmic adaptor subunit [Bacteroidota bacterium]|nr:efflux RND transporter periplasmic adaptor subunit [Bacteroidota bacterium]